LCSASRTLLTIIEEKPLFRIYQNLKLIRYSFKQNNEFTALKAHLIFQEARTAQSSSNGFPVNQVTNPQNSGNTNNGLSNAKTTSATQLNDIVNNI
jgi:hypothetical protein